MVVAEPRTMRIEPTLWPKQWLAMQLLGLLPGGPCDGGPYVEELLYGGQAGGGKSRLLREIGNAICLMWPGAQVRLFRRTYPELEEYIIPKLQEEIPSEVATWHGGLRAMQYVNGSELRCLHANRDEEVYEYKTAEWSALLIDQAEDFTPFQLRFLRHRVRQTKEAFGGRWHRIAVYSANPGGAAHQYLYGGFIDSHEPGTVFQAPQSDAGWRRCFLPARLADNPSLDADEYRQTLYGLPEHLVRAYLEGDWSYVVGAFFDEWRATDMEGAAWHVWTEAQLRALYDIPDDTPFPPPAWQKWAGVDGGFNDPWVVLFATKAPDGRVIVYREIYATKVGIPEQAGRIKAVAAQNDEKITAILCDPAMFTRNANLTWSDQQVYAEHGVTLTRGTNAREAGWRRVREFLAPASHDGYPSVVFVAGRTPNLVRTLPILMTDPAHPEDIKHGVTQKQDDHAADCLRYLLGPAAVAEQQAEATPMHARMDAAQDYRRDTDTSYREPEYVPEMGQTGNVNTWR